MRTKLTLAALTAAVLTAALLLKGCSTNHPNRAPIGEPFPSVSGQTLTEESVELPGALAGRPAILLLGYVQEAQFDADRWLIGLLQLKTPVPIREVPTIAGLFPRMLSGTIDNGMRSGIPSEDWSSVITVYAEAEQILAFTGNERPRNMRVCLLDAEGKVRWFHDRGFSAGKALELDRAARELLGEQEGR